MYNKIKKIHILLYKDSNDFGDLINNAKNIPGVKKILTYENKSLTNP